MGVPVNVGDRVLVATSTAGTGAYDLGAAVGGYLTPALAGVVSGSRVSYVVVDSLLSPSLFEIGEGTYTSAAIPTVSRTLIVRNNTGGTSAVSWSSGTKYVFFAPSASRFVMYDSDGVMYVSTYVAFAGGGSQSTTVVSPVTDRDTGLFFPGANRVALATNGSSRLEFNETGAALFNNSHGTSGQVLRTNGSTSAPTWASLTAANVGAVDKTGDVMSGTLSAKSVLSVYGSAETERLMIWQTGGATRWAMIADSAAESGSPANAGSNLVLRAVSDAGTTIGDVFEVTRSTRKADFKVVPSVNGTDLTSNLGTITQVSVGTGLTGGGTSGVVTLSIATTHGAVGTYSYAQYNGGGSGVSLDATTAGGNLSPTKSGTWKLMGAPITGTTVFPGDFGLWLRIS
jgi:hypothetical protein